MFSSGASEREEERELRWREGVVTERESCDRECDEERRSYAEGVESETGKREKELKVFESFEMYLLQVKLVSRRDELQLEFAPIPIADVAVVAKI